MAPVIPIGISEPSKMFSGTVSVKPETLRSVISDFAESFKHHDFKGTVIINQHGERVNIETLMKVSEELTERGIPTMMANPIRKIMDKIHDMMRGESPECDFHAGELETSFCLWKCPELVKTEIMKGLKPLKSNPACPYQGMIHGFEKSSRRTVTIRPIWTRCERSCHNQAFKWQARLAELTTRRTTP